MTNIKKGVKKQDIVFLNVLFCLIVVFIHISSEIINKMDHGESLYCLAFVLSRLSSFVVQGFILLSGIKLFLKIDSIKFGKFYISRLCSIIIPYVIWILVYYLYFCSIGYFNFSWQQLGWFILKGDISAQFYFIVILVQFYALMPIWKFLFKRGNIAATLVITLMISVITGACLKNIILYFNPEAYVDWVDISFLKYIFYWAAGCMIGMHYGQFQSYLKKNWMSIIVLFVLCGTANGWLSYVCMDTGFWWLELIHMFYIISALLFFYMLSQALLVGNGFLIKPFAWLDSLSFNIYLIHCLIIFITEDFLNYFAIYNLSVRYIWRAIMAYGGSIIVCSIWKAMRILIAKNRKYK